MSFNIITLYNKYRATYLSATIDIVKHTLSLYACFYYFNSSFIIIPLLSLLLHRTFVNFHDCVHNSYFPNNNLNYIIASVYGILTHTSTNWILDHHTHHLTNGNKENKYKFKFNELVYYNVSQYKQFNSFQKLLAKIFYNPIVFFTFFPFLYFFILQRFMYLWKKIKYGDKINNSLTMITINHLINNIGIIVLYWCLYKYNILPQYIISVYLSFIINFVLFFNQHTFNPPYVVGDEKWNIKDSGLKGSSHILIPSYLKYFTCGIEYHHIHHMNSRIPGYNMKNFHEEVKNNSNMFDNITILSMNDCYNNLWLMLYDDMTNMYVRCLD